MKRKYEDDFDLIVNKKLKTFEISDDTLISKLSELDTNIALLQRFILRLEQKINNLIKQEIYEFSTKEVSYIG